MSDHIWRDWCGLEGAPTLVDSRYNDTGERDRVLREGLPLSTDRWAASDMPVHRDDDVGPLGLGQTRKISRSTGTR